MTVGSLIGALGLVLDRARRRAGSPISRSGWCSASPWRRTSTMPPSPPRPHLRRGARAADHRADADRRLCLDRELAGDAFSARSVSAGAAPISSMPRCSRSSPRRCMRWRCRAAAPRPTSPRRARRAGAGQGAAAAWPALHSGGVGFRGLRLRAVRPVGASAGDLRALRHRCRHGGVDRRAVRAGAGRRAADRIRLRPQSASALGGALCARPRCSAPSPCWRVFGISVPAAAAFALMFGGANGLVTITRGAVPLALFGASGYGRLMGRLAGPWLLMQAAAPLVMAFVVDRASDPAALALAAGFRRGRAHLLCRDQAAGLISAEHRRRCRLAGVAGIAVELGAVEQAAGRLAACREPGRAGSAPARCRRSARAWPRPAPRSRSRSRSPCRCAGRRDPGNCRPRRSAPRDPGCPGRGRARSRS